MGRTIILILSIISLIASIAILIWAVTGMNTDIFDFISKEKTTTCTRQYIDTETGNEITDIMKITYKKDVLNVENINTTIYKDATTAEMSYQFSKLFLGIFNGIDGMNVSYTKNNENTVSYTLTIDYQQLDEEQLKTLSEDELYKDG